MLVKMRSIVSHNLIIKTTISDVTPIMSKQLYQKKYQNIIFEFVLSFFNEGT